MNNFALEFENVSKVFPPDKKVVCNLSFSVRVGEFFSILGPSGCGKTTCLRLISGLERPTQGLVRLSSRVVNDVHPHQRNVHTVFQKYALFPHLNVYDNIAFGLRMKRVAEREIKLKVQKMLEMVKLEAHSHRSVLELSGGEQQRVALIRALVNQPETLLLDEPLGALDLKLREQMQQELAEIQKKTGITFIFVTHDQGEALTLSDRVAIMNQGCIEQIGTPTEVYEHPASRFVAQFVGTTNVLSGSVNTINGMGKNGVVSVLTDELGMIFAKHDQTQLQLEEGSRVGVMIRPEKIRIRVTAPNAVSQSVHTIESTTIDTAGSSQTTSNAFRGILTERVYSGPTTQVKLQLQGKPQTLIALVANQNSTKMPALKTGERYYAVWDAQDSVLVPENNNNRAARVETSMRAQVTSGAESNLY